MAIRIGAGNHTISLHYASSGLQVGSIITCITIVLVTFLIICRRREWLFYKPSRTKKWAQNDTDAKDVTGISETPPSDIAEFLDLDIVIEDSRAPEHSKNNSQNPNNE